LAVRLARRTEGGKVMLTLPTKKKWFDMILSGEKLEEYRNDTQYYESRLDKYIGIPVKVRFRNGYRKDSPSFIRTVIPHYRRGGVQNGVRSRIKTT